MCGGDGWKCGVSPELKTQLAAVGIDVEVDYRLMRTREDVVRAFPDSSFQSLLDSLGVPWDSTVDFEILRLVLVDFCAKVVFFAAFLAEHRHSRRINDFDVVHALKLATGPFEQPNFSNHLVHTEAALLPPDVMFLVAAYLHVRSDEEEIRERLSHTLVLNSSFFLFAARTWWLFDFFNCERFLGKRAGLVLQQAAEEYLIKHLSLAPDRRRVTRAYPYPVLNPWQPLFDGTSGGDGESSSCSDDEKIDDQKFEDYPVERGESQCASQMSCEPWQSDDEDDQFLPVERESSEGSESEPDYNSKSAPSDFEAQEERLDDFDVDQASLCPWEEADSLDIASKSRKRKQT